MKPLPPQNQLLQITTWLTQILKQGKITLQTNGTEKLQLQIENNKIDLNFQQKELIKTLLELEPEMEKESILEKLKTLKNLAEKLKQNTYTITISYKGKTVLTLGSEAHPTISQIITGTNAVEVNNLKELMTLIKQTTAFL